MNDVLPLIIAVEDVLSEAVIKRLLQDTERAFKPSTIGLKGNTYLRAKARGLNRSAQGFPILMLTDLDDARSCAPSLITDWLGGDAKHDNFLFRVAVLEVEAWLLADRENLANLLDVPLVRLPLRPDDVADAKLEVLNLARASRSSTIRSDLLPQAQGTAQVGPNYNGRLTEFVQQTWNVEAARQLSDSLNRTYLRLLNFEWAQAV